MKATATTTARTPSSARAAVRSASGVEEHGLLESEARFRADGRPVVVDMPDNITTYRIMVVVSDRNGRAGSAEDKVTLKRPLMVQPVLPRFAYPDDELQIEALVWNGTPAAGSVQVATKLDGLKLVGGEARKPHHRRGGFRLVPLQGPRDRPRAGDGALRSQARRAQGWRRGEAADFEPRNPAHRGGQPAGQR